MDEHRYRYMYDMNTKRKGGEGVFFGLLQASNLEESKATTKM